MGPPPKANSQVEEMDQTSAIQILKSREGKKYEHDRGNIRNLQKIVSSSEVLLGNRVRIYKRNKEFTSLSLASQRHI